MECKIVLVYHNRRVAEAIVRGISPDNETAPPGLVVKAIRRGSEVHTLVKCNRSLKTFISTIDDLLMSVQVAERTVSKFESDCS